MALSINEDEISAILAEVDRELDGALAGARDRLKKADDEKSAPPADAAPEASASGSDAGGPPEASESAPPAEGSESAPPADDASASAPAPDASAPPADASAAPGADAGGEDLESKLSALPEDQLRHLYMAAKQALFARMASASADPSASAGGPPAGAPPAGPPMAPPPAPAASPSASAAPMAPPAGEPPMPPPAMKGEMKASPANGGGKTSAVKLGKSEDQQKIDDLTAQVEGLTKAVTMLVGAPLRKAITSVAHLPKPGDGVEKKEIKLSKTEITAKLVEVTRDPKLSKKDRELVNGYYDGRFNLEKVAHLLQ